MSELTHHQLGDSGSTHSHHRHHRLETSVSHHTSSAFHALHHEATALLSSPHHAISSNHIDKTSSANPASVKHAESVHNTAKTEKSAHTAKADASSKLAAHKPSDHSDSAGKNVAITKPEHADAAKVASAKIDATGTKSHLDALSSIPKLSIVNDGHNAKSSKQDLASMVPSHLLDKKPEVQRTAGTAGDTSLFAPSAAAKPSDHQKPAAVPAEKIAEKAAVAPAAKSFENNKSISDLTYSGAIVDRTSMRVESVVAKPQDKVAAGEVPAVKVSLQNPADKTTKPDFLIKKDGSVEMFNNALQSGQKNINVQFERSGDQVGITDAQKDAGAKFYTYLQGQLKSQYPQAQAEAFKTDDSQGVLRDSKLPPEVKQGIEQQQQRHDAPQGSGLPDHAAPTMQDTRRITQGGKHSSVPRGEVNDMTPPVQRLPKEAERVQAMKDTVASYVTRGEKEPYSYVTKHDDGRGWGIGRYGLTYKQMGNFLSGLSNEQIEELIKEGKLTPDQAQNLEKMRDSIQKAQESGNDNDLDPTLRAMRDGTGSADDMKNAVKQFFPDKVQELAASDQISKITGELAKDAMAKGQDPSINPGQVALSMALGRTIGKDEYMGNPQYKSFVESATQAYRLQEQSRIQGGDSINVENMSQVSGALNKMVGQQFWREAAGATEYGNKGCAIAVTRMLQHMGVHIGAHLDVNGTADDMRHQGWQEMSLAQAEKTGQLFVAVNKETGSHVGIGMGHQVWENSSAKRQVVTHDMSQSTLRHSGRAFIVPLHLQQQQPQQNVPIPKA